MRGGIGLEWSDPKKGEEKEMRLFIQQQWQKFRNLCLLVWPGLCCAGLACIVIFVDNKDTIPILSFAVCCVAIAAILQIGTLGLEIGKGPRNLFPGLYTAGGFVLISVTRGYLSSDPYDSLLSKGLESDTLFVGINFLFLSALLYVLRGR